MFTGLIEDVGTVQKLERRGSAAKLTVATALPCGEFSPGDSLAVNGVCLTVTSIAPPLLTFDVSPETLHTSWLGRLSPGERVNLERAMRLSDRLGGHIVTSTSIVRQQSPGGGKSRAIYASPSASLLKIAAMSLPRVPWP